MVNIKLFGALRLKCGISHMEVYSSSVKDACRLLSKATGFPEKDFKNCMFMINGQNARYSSKLEDGAELVFLTPSGGG